MPKLIQYALHEIGHPDVRFYGLRVPFTNIATGQPDHTYNALDNAGGKSTQIHLFFSQIVTNLKFYTRGSSNTKDMREIDSYFLPGDISWVVSEWTVDHAQMKIDGSPPTRIIGYVGHKPKVANEQGRHPLKRRFFSFVTSETFSFDSLPIGKAQTYQDALQWLSVARKDHPKLDWVITDNQGEWGEALRDRRFYPGIYRLMAEMNFQESNPFSAFKVNTPIEFFDIVLRALADEGAGTNLVHSFNQNQHEWSKRFEYENEYNWLNAVNKFMQEMVEPAEALDNIKKEIKLHSEKRSDLANRARKTVNYYEGEKKECEDAISQGDKQNSELENKRKKLEVELNWLEFHRRDHAVQVQQGSVQSAENSIEQAETELKLYAAAEICHALDQIYIEINAKQNTLEDLSKPAKELGNKLHALGYVWHQRIEENLKVIRGQITAKKELISELRNAQKNKVSEQAETNRHIKDLGNRIVEIEYWLNRQRKALGDLLQDHVVADHESAPEASSRLSAEIESAKNQISSLNAGLETNREERSGLREQKFTMDALAREKRTLIENIQVSISEYQQRESVLSQNNALCSSEQTDQVFLFDEGLTGRIEEYILRLESEHGRNSARLEGLRERLDLLEKHEVMPPSKDVRSMLEHLESQDISAFTYGQYFADNIQIPLDTIRELYLQDPSKASSIVFQGSEDFTRAKEIGQLDTISFPVQLVMETDFPTLDSDYKVEDKKHVVMPSSNAGFNRDAAILEKPVLIQEIETIEKNVESLTAERRALERVRGDIKAFLGQYASDYLRKQEAGLSDAEHVLEQTLKNMAAIENKLNENEEAYSLLKRDVKTANDRLSQLNINIERVRDYLTRYDENLEKNTLERKHALVESEKLKAQVQEIVRELKQLGLRENNTQSDYERLMSDQTTQRNEKKRIEYKNRSKASGVAQFAGEPDGFIITSYQSTKDSYKSEENKNEKLSAEISILKEAAGKKNQQLSIASRGLDIDEVKTAAMDGRFEFDPQAKAIIDNAVIKANVALENATNNLSAALEAKERFVDEHGVPDRPESYPDDLSMEKTAHLIEELGALVDTTKKQIVEIQKSIEGIVERKKGAAAECTAIKAVARSMVEFKNLTSDDREKCFETSEAFAEEYSAVAEKGADLESSRKEIQFKVDSLNSDIDNCVNDDKFPNVTKSFKERLSKLKNQYHVNTKEHVNTINERMLSLKDTIDQNEDRRQRLLDLFQTEVEHYIGKLLDIEKTSRMPVMQGYWRLWSKKRFVEVKAEKCVRDPQFVRSKLEILIKRFFVKDQKGRFASGFKLIQDGVHAVLMGNAKIRVFKYHDVPTLKRFDIEKAAQFSGGQRAVMAIICYIAISRLVSATQKGMGENPTILLLDNPTGSLSKSSFIQQAIETANFSNVQLAFYSALLEPAVSGQFDVYNTFKTNKFNARGEMVVNMVGNNIPEDRGKSHPMIQATFINREAKQSGDIFTNESPETA